MNPEPTFDIRAVFGDAQRQLDMLLEQGHYAEYFSQLTAGIIPEEFPGQIPYTPGGVSSMLMNHAARDVAIHYGTWPILEMRWLRKLSELLGPEARILEVMAGRGWISKGLRDLGHEVIATDLFSSHGSHAWHDPKTQVTEVLPCEASDAVWEYADECNVLLMSWPPYEEPDAYRAMQTWGRSFHGQHLPVVYIGEDRWGCNADAAFHAHFVRDKIIHIPTWDGIHDSLVIGHYESDPQRMRYRDPEYVDLP